LLWTLETGLGNAWSDDAAMAWTKAYQILAGAMLEGAGASSKNAA
jgi:nitric oxide dioxygenase